MATPVPEIMDIGSYFHMNAWQYKSLCNKLRNFTCEFSIEIREVLKKSSYVLIWNQFALKINSPLRPVASGENPMRNHLNCAAHTNENTRPGSATEAQDVLKLCGSIHCKWSPELCVRRDHSLAPQIACIFMARSAVSQTMASENSPVLDWALQLNSALAMLLFKEVEMNRKSKFLQEGNR
jgi:hypothetical protein